MNIFSDLFSDLMLCTNITIFINCLVKLRMISMPFFQKRLNPVLITGPRT